MKTLSVARLNGQPEIFYTLQGEGKSIGRPSVFIRLSRCNLYCHWCDTPYTWNWVGTKFEHQSSTKYDPKAEMAEMTVDDVLAKVLAFRCGNIVLTGGEPLLQQEEAIPLLLSLARRGARVEVETNGTIVPVWLFDHWVSQYNVSPKLANSKNAPQHRTRSKAYEFFSQSQKAWFKFVVCTPDDMQEVLSLVEQFKIPHGRVLLMPEGTVQEAIAEKMRWIAEVCKEHGFSMTTRLHVQIWGAARGVYSDTPFLF